MTRITARTLTSVIGAATMTGLLFVYSRSSIQAAKRDAARHRAADGGQISWRNESLRRHGVLDRPDKPDLLNTLFSSTKKKNGKGPATGGIGRAEDDGLHALKDKIKKVEK